MPLPCCDGHQIAWIRTNWITAPGGDIIFANTGTIDVHRRVIHEEIDIICLEKSYRINGNVVEIEQSGFGRLDCISVIVSHARPHQALNANHRVSRAFGGQVSGIEVE